MSGKMMEAGEENGASRAREYSDRYWEACGGMLLEREVERASIIASLIPEDSNSVLEVGCGDGLIINMVTGTGRETMGLDLSESGLKGVRGPATLGSVSELPFEDESWDAVIASEVIEHIPEEDYRQSLREISRVSRSCIIV
ncbi:MAG TPA: class I SAM-dependent methyltransferase, partial [Candidatus Anoxymicrobiaceae bacterium]